MQRLRISLALGLSGILMSACGGKDSASDSKSGGSDETAGEFVIDTAVESPGENCTTGGIALISGVDVDENGVLDEEEIEGTQYICTAVQEIIDTVDLMEGNANCPTGGVMIVRGSDLDGDGMLSVEEVESESYVCQGGAATGGGNVDTGGCAVPARWDTDASACVVSRDWADADLSGASLESSYLAGVDFSGADLSGANLAWSELRGADLTGANLTGTDLMGVDLSDATLTDVIATALVNCPAQMPNGWTCLDLGAAGNTFIGPDRDLSRLDLTGADLSGADLDGLRAIDLLGCPDTLPAGWQCLDLPQTGNTLVGPEANLSGLDLSSADLSGVDLNGADLSGANLSGADLSNADLSDANLDSANLTGANLTQADLADAVLDDAVLDGANLVGADLQDASVDGASFVGADLSQSELGGVSFDTSTDLTNVRAVELQSCPDSLPGDWDCVSDANGDDVLVGPSADVSGVDFSGEDLSGINFTGADLSGADLTNVDLSDATFAGANLSNADVSNADLSNVDLSTATMAGVRGQSVQACPDGLPTDWACIVDGNGDETLVGPSADMSGIDFEAADFSGSNLSGADLSGANLTDSDLSGTNLSNVDLTNTVLEGATTTLSTDFTGATFDNTTCPDGSNSDSVANGGTCF